MLESDYCSNDKATSRNGSLKLSGPRFQTEPLHGPQLGKAILGSDGSIVQAGIDKNLALPA